MLKMSLYNEALWPEIETFGFQFQMRPRKTASQIFSRPRRDCY